MATLKESPINGTTHNQSTPEDAANLAGDRLRVREALQVQNLVKGRKYLDALTDAETRAAYGDAFKSPEGDDMIAVDSNFKTEHHYHAPTQPGTPSKPLPAWLKAALIAAGVAGAGGGGWWLASNLKPSDTSAANAKEFELDFWEPEPKS